MFTGLIREIGKVEAVRNCGGKRTIRYHAPRLRPLMALGDSVAVDGACQTVTALLIQGFEAEALGATLEKTTLGSLRPGQEVNLEPATAAGERLGGHIVQGHVSGMARVLSLKAVGEDRWLELELPPSLVAECAHEGSIAVDGVSLTIARQAARRVSVNVIPTTWRGTTLGRKKPGSLVNIETDALARAARAASPERRGKLTEKELRTWGY